MEQVTLNSDDTVRESPQPDSALTVHEPRGERTLREGAPEVFSSVPLSASAHPSEQETFRGYTILEQLPTKGAEADIYLVRTQGIQAGEGDAERTILKLYRHRLEPKLEVLNRISEISRTHSRCFVVFKDVGFDEHTGRWYELQEYFPLGSLKDVPGECKHRLDFIKNLVSELTQAIHCLHSNGIIHCDIKPGNVLVRSLAPLDLVLTDFGISSLLASDMSQKMTSLKGTPMYWAPEAFSRVLGRPCDWWGMGMIVLELLAGAHPLEGLLDSQIIHKLTLGNIEIPDDLDADCRLLLRGLLTKDDRKRWGHQEVVRWLAGEYDIPVFYEIQATSRPEETSKKNPFRFDGKDFFSAEELARAFCEREGPWQTALSYLRYIRQWLESNMLFDEAVELGNDIGKLEPDIALFHFVHSHAKCPFIFLGKLVDFNNLRLFLGRAARMEADSAENRIVKMMGSGELASLYEDYIKHSGNRDPELQELLGFMDKKTPEDQWFYFEVLNDPAAVLWPEGMGTGDRVRTLQELRALGIVPVKRAFLKDLQARCVLPFQIQEMLRSPSTYASGAKQLKELRKQELLIPRGAADTFCAFYEKLNIEEYVQRARVLCMGHTPAILERLELILEAFHTLPLSSDELERTVLSQVFDRLEGLKNQKITALDTLSLGKLFDLFKKRHGIKQAWAVMLPISGVCGAMGLWLVCMLLGARSTSILRTIFVIGLIALSIYFLLVQGLISLDEENRPWRSWGPQDPRIFLVVLVFYTPFILFDRILARYPLMLPLSMGAILGCAGYHLFFKYSMSRNFRKIVDFCASYCASAAGQKDYTDIL